MDTGESVRYQHTGNFPPVISFPQNRKSQHTFVIYLVMEAQYYSPISSIHSKWFAWLLPCLLFRILVAPIQSRYLLRTTDIFCKVFDTGYYNALNSDVSIGHKVCSWSVWCVCESYGFSISAVLLFLCVLTFCMVFWKVQEYTLSNCFCTSLYIFMILKYMPQLQRYVTVKFFPLKAWCIT